MSIYQAAFQETEQLRESLERAPQLGRRISVRDALALEAAKCGEEAATELGEGDSSEQQGEGGGGGSLAPHADAAVPVDTGGRVDPPALLVATKPLLGLRHKSSALVKAEQPQPQQPQPQQPQPQQPQPQQQKLQKLQALQRGVSFSAGCDDKPRLLEQQRGAEAVLKSQAADSLCILTALTDDASNEQLASRQARGAELAVEAKLQGSLTWLLAPADLRREQRRSMQRTDAAFGDDRGTKERPPRRNRAATRSATRTDPATQRTVASAAEGAVAAAATVQMELELGRSSSWQGPPSPLQSGTMRIEALCPKSEASASISLPLLSDVAQLQLVRRSTVARSPRLPHPHSRIRSGEHPPTSLPQCSSQAVEEQLGIRRAAQSIIYGGRLLRSEELVGDVLHDGAVIFVQVDTTPAPPPTHSPWPTPQPHTQPGPTQSRRTQRAWTNPHPNPTPNPDPSLPYPP